MQRSCDRRTRFCGRGNAVSQWGVGEAGVRPGWLGRPASAVPLPFVRLAGRDEWSAGGRGLVLRAYSGWILAALMMRPHLSDSWVWNLASSAGVLVNTSVPVDL